MKALKFLGSAAYGAVIYYLMYLLFYWLVPVVISLSWGWFVALLLFGGGFLFMFAAAGGSFLAMPIAMMSAKCNAAKYPPLLFGVFFAYQTVKLPWMLDMDYDALRTVWAVTLTIAILVCFIIVMVIPFKNTKE